MIRWQVPARRRDRSLLVLCLDVMSWAAVIALIAGARAVLIAFGV